MEQGNLPANVIATIMYSFTFFCSDSKQKKQGKSKPLLKTQIPLSLCDQNFICESKATMGNSAVSEIQI